MKNINQNKSVPVSITPNCEVKASPIHTALSDIADRLEAIESLAKLLNERLDPVLQTLPGASVCQNDSPLEHGMVGQLRAIERRLSEHVETLSDIRDRVLL